MKYMRFKKMEYYPRVWRRCSCHERPKGRIGHEYQYQGLNERALGNVITLLGPHGIFHLSLRSATNDMSNKLHQMQLNNLCISIYNKMNFAIFPPL